MNEEHIDYELLFNELCAKYDVLRTENEELRSSNTVLRDNNEVLRTQLEELKAWLDEINQYRIELEFCLFPIEQWLARRPKDTA